MPKSGQVWDPALLTHSPLFAPFERWVSQFSGREGWPSASDYTALCEQSRRETASELAKLEFAPSRPRPRRFKRERITVEELYDGSIARLGRVPCLEASYHDLWNAVAFAAFPRAKRALHGRQYRALLNWIDPQSARLPMCRTREQDALAVFDEGGSVLFVDPGLRGRWETASAPLELFDVRRLLLFGHALMEHISYGRREVRSCAVFLPWQTASAPDLGWVDRELAARLDDPHRFQAPGADGVVVLDATGRLWLEPRSSSAVATPDDDSVEGPTREPAGEPEPSAERGPAGNGGTAPEGSRGKSARSP